MNYNYEQGAYSVSAEGLNSFMSKVFGWLFIGLLVSATVGYAFLSSLNFSITMINLAANPTFLIALVIFEFVLVLALSAGIRKIGSTAAKFLFLLYASVNGVTLSYLCMIYAANGAPVGIAFLLTAVFFGSMCLYGYFTKADLTSIGKILMFGLFALLACIVINMFLGSSLLDFAISIVGVAIFVALTAYDVQKIKNQYYSVASAEGSETASKLAVLGALSLYLDFINIFLYILRLFSRRR